MVLGALEAGGTKMVCAIGDETGRIFSRISIPTDTPETTLPKLSQYFLSHQVQAVGIGTFGPADLHVDSPTYGCITTTPKLAWRNCDIRGFFVKTLGVPVGFDTDVNAAALGEATFGCLRGLDTALYLTIGTGIGGGVLANGKLLHGMLHPEAGHLLLSRNPADPFAGCCPYHRDCLEGLASGPAIEGRCGKKASELPADDAVWALEAEYIAKALVNYILILSPQRIVLGGGVMHQEQLFPLIREQVARLLGGYINTPELADLAHYIVPPSLNDNQGAMGCFKLAADALGEASER